MGRPVLQVSKGRQARKALRARKVNAGRSVPPVRLAKMVLPARPGRRVFRVHKVRKEPLGLSAKLGRPVPLEKMVPKDLQSRLGLRVKFSVWTVSAALKGRARSPAPMMRRLHLLSVASQEPP